MASDDSTSRSALGRLSPRAIGGIVAAVVAVLFILSNREQANVSFVVVDADVALWLALTLSFALGLAVGFLVLGRRRGKGDNPKS